MSGARRCVLVASAALLLLTACPEERPGVEKRIPGERLPPAEAVGAAAGGTPPVFRRGTGPRGIEPRREPGSATLIPAPAGSPPPAPAPGAP